MRRIFIRFIKSWREFWQTSQYQGFLFTLVTVIYNFIPQSLFHAKSFALVTKKPYESSISKAEALGVRPATLYDINLLSHCGYPRPVLAHWFERGARAWLIEREEKLLACYWLDENESYYLYDWLVLKSAPKNVWAIWWWVAPEYRKQHLANQVRIPAISEYARAEFTQILGVVDRLNGNALRATQKLRWKFVGGLFILRILGITFVRFGDSFRVGRWDFDSVLELPIEELLWKVEYPE